MAKWHASSLRTAAPAALREYLLSRHMMAHRYHATVHKREKETMQLGEFLVVAANDGQAREKVKHHLLGQGKEEAAHSQAYTVDLGNARMAHLEVIY